MVPASSGVLSGRWRSTRFEATSGPNGAFSMSDSDTAAGKPVRISGQLGGVDRISLQMTDPRLAHADLLRGIELLGPEVAPWVAQDSTGR